MTALNDEYRRRAAQAMPFSDIRAQMPVLYAWANRPGVQIIELGVRWGYSTCAFLAGIERGTLSVQSAYGRDIQIQGSLWSVDINEPKVPEEWRQLPFWHLLVADDNTPQAVDFCPGDADVLFIDTSHYYTHTLAELRLYAPKVAPGGVILMHDTGPGDWPEVGKALDSWCAESGNSWYAHHDWPGLGVVEISGQALPLGSAHG